MSEYDGIEIINQLKSQYDESVEKLNLINQNFWAGNAFVEATPEGLERFMKIKEKVKLSAQNSSPTAGPTSRPILNEESQQVLALLDQMATDNIISQYIDLYLSPIALGDINYRLGNVMGVKNDFTPTDLSDDHGNLYTPTNFTTDLRWYSIKEDGGFHNIKERYVNLFFPPFQSYNSQGDAETVSALEWFNNYKKKYESNDETRQDFSTKYLVRTPIESTFRTPGFKLINDNIIFLQHLFEGLSGVVSTYMTEWDMSLYLQEKLMTTFKDNNMTIDSFMWLTYRLREDNPYGYKNESELSSIATVNYAVSKIKNTNIVPWYPQEYPLAKWWRPYFENYDSSKGMMSFYELLSKTPNKIAEFPYCDVPTIIPKTELDKKFLKKSVIGHRSDLYERIRFDDHRGAAFSGWDLISSMATYQTLYVNSGDGVNEVDNAIIDNYLTNSSKTNLAQLVEAIKDMNGDTSSDSIASNPNIDIGNTISGGSGGIEEYNGIVILGVEIPGSKLLRRFLNRSKIEANANKSANIQSANRSKGFQSFFATPKIEDLNANQGSMVQDPGLEASGAKTEIQVTPEGEEIKYLSDEAENTKYSSFDGISPWNPVFVGGPHGLYKSPETLQGYFEQGNLFLRNSPRVSGYSELTINEHKDKNDNIKSVSTIKNDRWKAVNSSYDVIAYRQQFKSFQDGVEKTYFNSDPNTYDLKSKGPTSTFALLKNGVVWTNKKRVNFWTNRKDNLVDLNIEVAKPIRDYNRSGRGYSNYIDYYSKTFYPEENASLGVESYSITDSSRSAVDYYHNVDWYGDRVYSYLAGRWSRYRYWYCGCDYHQTRYQLYDFFGSYNYHNVWDWSFDQKYRTQSAHFIARPGAVKYYSYVTYDSCGRSQTHYVPMNESANWSFAGQYMISYYHWSGINYYSGPLEWWSEHYRRSVWNNYYSTRSRYYGRADRYLNWRNIDGFVTDVNMHDMPNQKWTINKVKFVEYHASVSWSSGWPGFWRSVWNWIRGGPRNVRTLSYSITKVVPDDCYILRFPYPGYTASWGGHDSQWNWKLNTEIVSNLLSQTGNIWSYKDHNVIMCETDLNGNYTRLFHTRLRLQERKITVYKYVIIRTWRERVKCRWVTRYEYGWVPRNYNIPYIEAELDSSPTFMSSCSFVPPRNLSGKDFVFKSIPMIDNSMELKSGHPTDMNEASAHYFEWNSGYHPAGEYMNREDPWKRRAYKEEIDLKISYLGLTGTGILTKIQGLNSELSTNNSSHSGSHTSPMGLEYNTVFHSDWIHSINVPNKNGSRCKGGVRSDQTDLSILNVKRTYTRVEGWNHGTLGPYDEDTKLVYFGSTPIISYHYMPTKLNEAINRSLLCLTFYKHDAINYQYSVWYNVNLSDPFRLFFAIMAKQLSDLENCRAVFNSSAIENMHLILNNCIDKDMVNCCKEFPEINETFSKVVRDERAKFNFWIYLANGLIYNEEMAKKSTDVFLQALNERINLYRNTLNKQSSKNLISVKGHYSYNDLESALKDIEFFDDLLKNKRVDFVGNGVVINPELKIGKIGNGVGKNQDTTSDGYKAFENISLEEFFYIYLQLLYQYRKYFINKRFNKIDGTYWVIRHYETLARYALSKASTVEMKGIEPINTGRPKTIPIVAYLTDNTPDDKMLAMVGEADPLSEDKVRWVFHKVEYYFGNEKDLTRYVDKSGTYGDVNNPKVGAPGCYWKDKNGGIIIELLNGKKAYLPVQFSYRVLSDDIKESDDIKKNIKIDQMNGDDFSNYKETYQNKIIESQGCSEEDNFYIQWNSDENDSDNVGYHILELTQPGGRVVRNSSIWYDYVIGMDPTGVTAESLSSGDLLQDVICKNSNKIDLWAVRIPDSKMPPVRYFVKNPTLTPYYPEVELDSNIGADPVLGGVLAYTQWPIKEKQNGSFIPEEYKVLKLPH